MTARETQLRRLVAMLGWALTKKRRPLRWGNMTVRYILSDDHGDLYFSNLDDVERKVRMASEPVR